MTERLIVPALRVQQGRTRELFSAAINGKEISKIAGIKRVARESQDLIGYQRPEVNAHIKEIKEYIESDNPMIPNAIVIAFDERVQFVPLEPGSDHGHLEIPLVKDGEKRPGLIVDGQQRSAAIRESTNDHFIMPVSAFITASLEEQREQFMLVNSTKPLPKGLLYELAPHTSTRSPSALRKKKFPFMVLERLNGDEDSPFRGKIITATNPFGLVKDNSILKMIESSLYNGALHQFRDRKTGEGDIDAMVDLMVNYWLAVRDIWPNLWDLKPKFSRLLHGAGVASLGSVMDAMVDQYQASEGAPLPGYDYFYHQLLKIEPFCRWDGGSWEFAPDDIRKWNTVENTSKDVTLLTEYLVDRYLDTVWA